MTPPLRVAEGQHPQSLEVEIQRKATLRFLLFLPQGYERSEQRWPLLLFLHGSGERGEDLDRVKVHGPPKIVQTRKDFPFVVVSPQISEGRKWDSDELLALLDRLTPQLKIDPDRVYVTGLSMGGFGAWELAMSAPERFAAIAPISGSGDDERACGMKNVPVWAFHGAQDDVVALARGREIVDAVRACGGDVTFTVYPDAGHDAWTRTYENQKLYEWLLAHRRAARE
jgi:predicted peptidase